MFTGKFEGNWHDRPVKSGVATDSYRDNYDAIFGKKDKESDSKPNTTQSILDENLEAIEATGDAEAIKFALQNCMRFTDKQLFAQAVFEALKPVLDRQFLEIDSFNPSPDKRVVVNESLSYDIQGDSLRIHIFTGGLGNLSRYVEGLDVVAEVLEQHPEVTTVDAISWIVVKHPDILERKLGFTVQREADKKPTAKIVDGEEIGYAYMDREDFLTKYLKKK